MSPHSLSVRVPSVLAAVPLFALAAGPPPLAARPNLSAPNKPLAAYDSAAVERAKAGAARRLQDPACLKVLTDFRDREGRTLAENLQAWGVSAAEYVQIVPFRDGASVPLCQRQTVRLATTPGSPPVYVCPAAAGLGSPFAQIQARNPSLAEAMVIHEILHTLGLGENPPTTFEITERVRARCR